MITDNKDEFMNSVSMIAERYRERSYEAVLEGFMRSIIKDSMVITVPKTLDNDSKAKIAESVTNVIKNSSKEFVHSALNDESGTMHDVNFAHEIVNPNNFNESVQKLLAEHIYEESKDRSTVLEAEFDAGKFNNMTSEECLSYIEAEFSNEMFDNRFINGESLKSSLKYLMSTEGEDLVESIKQDVSNLVTQTEAKNSVIREAVSEINDKKAQIEEKINGEAETYGEAKGENEEKSSGGDLGGEEQPTEEGESNNTDENSMGDAESAMDTDLSKEDLYSVYDNTPINPVFKNDNFYKNFDKDSFSREAAEEILDEFRQLDDGISSDDGKGDENTQSMSENDENSDDGKDKKEESNEEYTTVDGDEIVINGDLFNYDKIESEKLSVESLAKDFIPLNLVKIGKRQIKFKPKLAAYLALSNEESAEQFFEEIRNRHVLAMEMMSKEGDIIEDMAKDDINERLEDIIQNIEKIKETRQTLLENLGILGILDGKYQRSESHIDNAFKSTIKPELIKQISAEDIKVNKDIYSKEELIEHDLAEIFKISFDLANCKNELANGIDVIGNKSQVGYLNELINEKMYDLDSDIDKNEIKEKVNAIQSIEGIIPIKDIVNMQAFMTKYEPEDKPKNRITLESFKDIDAYGYSYIDEIAKIKTSIKSKYKEHMKDSSHLAKIDFDIDELVDFVAEEIDTTKIKSNLFEKVISKLSERTIITNSTEGLIMKNKARAITTGYVAATKLGYLNDTDQRQIREYLM